MTKPRSKMTPQELLREAIYGHIPYTRNCWNNGREVEIDLNDGSGLFEFKCDVWVFYKYYSGNWATYDPPEEICEVEKVRITSAECGLDKLELSDELCKLTEEFLAEEIRQHILEYGYENED